MFVHAEQDHWKRLLLQRFGGDFRFQGGSYKETFRARCQEKQQQQQGSRAWSEHKPISVAGFYHDILHFKWRCAAGQLPQKWLTGVENVVRMHAPSLQEFITKCEKPNRPAIITGVSHEWTAARLWTPEYLMETFGEVKMKAGAVSFKLRDYFQYSRNITGLDESALYLFDQHFVQNAPALGKKIHICVCKRTLMICLDAKPRLVDYIHFCFVPLFCSWAFHGASVLLRGSFFSPRRSAP